MAIAITAADRRKSPLVIGKLVSPVAGRAVLGFAD
jgi:hypothetical protein